MAVSGGGITPDGWRWPSYWRSIAAKPSKVRDLEHLLCFLSAYFGGKGNNDNLLRLSEIYRFSHGPFQQPQSMGCTLWNSDTPSHVVMSPIVSACEFVRLAGLQSQIPSNLTRVIIRMAGYHGEQSRCDVYCPEVKIANIACNITTVTPFHILNSLSYTDKQVKGFRPCFLDTHETFFPLSWGVCILHQYTPTPTCVGNTGNGS